MHHHSVVALHWIPLLELLIAGYDNGIIAFYGYSPFPLDLNMMGIDDTVMYNYTHSSTSRPSTRQSSRPGSRPGSPTKTRSTTDLRNVREQPPPSLRSQMTIHNLLKSQRLVGLALQRSADDQHNQPIVGIRSIIRPGQCALAVTVSCDRVMRLWDLKRPGVIATKTHCHNSIITCMDAMSDSGVMATASADGVVIWWLLSDQNGIQEICKASVTGEPVCMTYDVHRNLWWVACGDGMISAYIVNDYTRHDDVIPVTSISLGYRAESLSFDSVFGHLMVCSADQHLNVYSVDADTYTMVEQSTYTGLSNAPKYCCHVSSSDLYAVAVDSEIISFAAYGRTHPTEKRRMLRELKRREHDNHSLGVSCMTLPVAHKAYRGSDDDDTSYDGDDGDDMSEESDYAEAVKEIQTVTAGYVSVKQEEGRLMRTIDNPLVEYRRTQLFAEEERRQTVTIYPIGQESPPPPPVTSASSSSALRSAIKKTSPNKLRDFASILDRKLIALESKFAV